MLLYRSLVVGMLGAIAMLVAVLPSELRPRAAPAVASSAVVHLSMSALARSPAPFGVTLATAVAQQRGEWIVGVDGMLAPSHLVTVTLSDGRTERTVVVAIEP